MNQAVTIGRGYYVVDAQAWVEQRVGSPEDVLTESLHQFTTHDVFRNDSSTLDMSARMQLWCVARDWIITEPSPVYHDQGCLSASITVVLAYAAQPDGAAYALVQVDDDRPVVCRDRTTEEGYWSQVRAVDIVCPGGHRWSWLDDADLLDDAGTYSTIPAVFGPDRDAPFSPCRDCRAFDEDLTDVMCDCGRGWAIYCPTCDQRCQLALTHIPTHPVATGAGR